MAAEWEKTPLKLGAQKASIESALHSVRGLDVSLIDVTAQATERLYQRIDELLLSLNVTQEQQEQLAVHRLLAPEIVESVTGVSLDVDTPHYDPPSADADDTVKANRLAFAKTMNLLVNRGLIHDDYRYRVTLRPDGTIGNYREWMGHDDIPVAERSVRFAIGGEIRPEWRERKLRNVPRERLLTLHEQASDTLIATMMAIAKRTDTDRQFSVGMAMSRIEPLMQEYIFHRFSCRMLSKGRRVTEPYSLSPHVESGETESILIEEFFVAAREIFRHNALHVADLAFHMGVTVKKEIGKTYDPALHNLSEGLLARSRIDCSAVYPIRTFIPMLPWARDWKAFSQLYVSDAYDVMLHEVPSEREITDLVATLMGDGVKVRRGVILPNAHGGTIEFTTKAGVVVQLQREQYERASIAAVEAEDDSHESHKVSAVHLYRTVRNGWTRIGTLTIEHERNDAQALVTYDAALNGTGGVHRNQISFWNGVCQERTMAIHVSTAYWGHGNVVFKNGEFAPVWVNPYDSTNPPGSLFLPRVERAPQVPA